MKAIGVKTVKKLRLCNVAGTAYTNKTNDVPSKDDKKAVEEIKAIAERFYNE